MIDSATAGSINSATATGDQESRRFWVRQIRLDPLLSLTPDLLCPSLLKADGENSPRSIRKTCAKY
jgi:hypothetical protein